MIKGEIIAYLDQFEDWDQIELRDMEIMFNEHAEAFQDETLLVLDWRSEDRTGALVADVLEGATMYILPLAAVGKEGYEVADPDGQVVGCFSTVDKAQIAASKAAARWLEQ